MGNEIDWSKAPEGAEYWCEMQWFRTIDGEWFVWCHGVYSWVKTAYSAPDNFSWWGNAVPRPSATWNGTGLPPVGTVCELSKTNGVNSWTKVEIVYISKSCVVYRTAIEELCDFSYEMMFRPIRTHEQIAAEERDKAIDEMHRMIDSDRAKHFRLLCEALYDAGYRRVEAK